MSFVFYEWTREWKFTLHSEMKPGECSNANTRTCNGIIYRQATLKGLVDG